MISSFGNINDEQLLISIVPNPNNGIFTLNISSSNDTPVKVTMVNYIGVQIFKKENVSVNNGIVYKIERKELPAGIYIVTVEQDESRYSRKVLIGR